MPGFNVLDPEIDLNRSYFLEASAGTGKTFTIENIVVRLLQEGYEVDQILIVTFTRAATMELKIRIRNHLERLFDKGPFAYSDFTAHQTKLKNIRKALTQFDRAQIHTIHGFCFYLLQEFAFETHFPLNQEEKSVSPDRIKVLLKDFLRTGLTRDEIHPRQLEKVLKRYQGDFDRFFGELMAPKFSEGRPYQLIWEQLKASMLPFFSIREKIVEELVGLTPSFGGLCNRSRQLKKEYLEKFHYLKALFEGNDLHPVDLPLVKMVPENLIGKKSYPELLANLNQNVIPLLIEISDFQQIMGRLSRRAQGYLSTYFNREDLFFYDDLLKQIHSKIECPRFCEKIRAKYRVVLIDEFQDTDRLQWEIFSRLFYNHLPLYLVGDPKQSIYRFRGADLYTYKEAKATLGEENYATLNLNFRAQPPLVEALNTLFQRAPSLITLPKTAQQISIEPVKAALPHSHSSGLYFCHSDGEEELFAFIFQEIERLHLEEKIAYHECAILVKDRYQAKRLVTQCPLPFVNRRQESLIESDAFYALEDFLIAIDSPRDRNRIVKVLGGPLFALDVDELMEVLEERSLFFFRSKEFINNQGIMAFFHRFKGELCFPNRPFFLDFLQLIELLSQRGGSLEECLFVLKKFREEDPESDELKARAKSDEEAIEIMTLHASKGLEFEVVFPIALLCGFEKEDEEDRSEKMRQLYVALTRAKRFLYLPLSSQEDSAVHFFLSEVLKGETLSAFLSNHPYFSYVDVSEKRSRGKIKKAALKVQPKQEIVAKPSFCSCLIHSFTSLAEKREPLEATRLKPEIPLGVETGIILHRILESLNFQISQAALSPLLASYLKETHLEQCQQPIESLIWKTLYHPLVAPTATFSLSCISREKCISEMEFLYTSITPEGYLKGFVDLFFEYQNRYYIIDWKSNYLENYGKKALGAAIKENQYDLQAKIYAQAARKYLKIFKKENQFAGVFYLFLRGLDSEKTEGVYFFHG